MHPSSDERSVLSTRCLPGGRDDIYLYFYWPEHYTMLKREKQTVLLFVLFFLIKVKVE